MYRTSVVASVRGVVLDSNWNESNVNLNRNNPENSNENLGARRSVRDFGLSFYPPEEAFSQPPSILPISAILLCI